MANQIKNNVSEKERYTEKRTVLINYANDPFKPSQHLQTKTALKHCHFDEIIEYSDKDIDNQFYNKNKIALDTPRGGGLWLWKPYIILKTLRQLNDGDICMYIDSGVMFMKDVTPVIDILKSSEVWITEIPLIEKQWTKRLCFVKMGCEGEKFEETCQVAGGYIAVKKSEFTVKLIQEWLNYACDYELLSSLDRSDKEAENEIPEFIKHIEDESIWSLLTKKYNIKAYSDPSQWIMPEVWIAPGRMISYENMGRRDYAPFLLIHRSRGRIKIMRIFLFWIAYALPPTVSSGLMLIYKRLTCGNSVCKNFKERKKIL